MPDRVLTGGHRTGDPWLLAPSGLRFFENGRAPVKSSMRKIDEAEEAIRFLVMWL